jgi:hypothetical protein
MLQGIKYWDFEKISSILSGDEPKAILVVKLLYEV